MTLEEYWNITPTQFKKHYEVYIRKEKMRAKEQDISNFYLGRYVMFAFNSPKKYPNKPFLDTITDETNEKNETPMTDVEMERVMRKNTLILGGKIQKHEG